MLSESSIFEVKMIEILDMCLATVGLLLTLLILVRSCRFISVKFL